MIQSGVDGFFERGGYMLSENGTQFFYGGHAVVACGDVAALGNRGGGFDECQGISGQVAVGPRQLAWAVKWAGPLRYSTNSVGNVHQTGVGKVLWKDRLMRMEYTSRLGTQGLVLMKFATDLSAEIIREAMEAEGLTGL